MKDKVIIYRKHDRHVEDIVEVFTDTPENWEKLKKRCQKDWCMESGFTCNAPGSEGHWSSDLSDYEWGWDSSYWSSLTRKEVKDVKVEPLLPTTIIVAKKDDLIDGFEKVEFFKYTPKVFNKLTKEVRKGNYKMIYVDSLKELK